MNVYSFQQHISHEWVFSGLRFGVELNYESMPGRNWIARRCGMAWALTDERHPCRTSGKQVVCIPDSGMGCSGHDPSAVFLSGRPPG